MQLPGDYGGRPVDPQAMGYQEIPSETKNTDKIFTTFEGALHALGEKAELRPGIKLLIGRVSHGKHKGEWKLYSKGIKAWWDRLSGKTKFKKLGKTTQTLTQLVSNYITDNQSTRDATLGEPADADKSNDLDRYTEAGAKNLAGRLLVGKSNKKIGTLTKKRFKDFLTKKATTLDESWVERTLDISGSLTNLEELLQMQQPQDFHIKQIQGIVTDLELAELSDAQNARYSDLMVEYMNHPALEITLEDGVTPSASVESPETDQWTGRTRFLLEVLERAINDGMNPRTDDILDNIAELQQEPLSAEEAKTLKWHIGTFESILEIYKIRLTPTQAAALKEIKRIQDGGADSLEGATVPLTPDEHLHEHDNLMKLDRTSSEQIDQMNVHMQALDEASLTEAQHNRYDNILDVYLNHTDSTFFVTEQLLEEQTPLANAKDIHTFLLELDSRAITKEERAKLVELSEQFTSSIKEAIEANYLSPASNPTEQELQESISLLNQLGSEIFSKEIESLEIEVDQLPSNVLKTLDILVGENNPLNNGRSILEFSLLLSSKIDSLSQAQFVDFNRLNSDFSRSLQEAGEDLLQKPNPPAQDVLTLASLMQGFEGEEFYSQISELLDKVTDGLSGSETTQYHQLLQSHSEVGARITPFDLSNEDYIDEAEFFSNIPMEEIEVDFSLNDLEALLDKPDSIKNKEETIAALKKFDSMGLNIAQVEQLSELNDQFLASIDAEFARLFTLVSIPMDEAIDFLVTISDVKNPSRFEIQKDELIEKLKAQPLTSHDEFMIETVNDLFKSAIKAEEKNVKLSGSDDLTTTATENLINEILDADSNQDYED